MEKDTIDLEVCENQIEIDFAALEAQQTAEEESSILPEGFVVSKNNDWIDEEVLFIVIKKENEDVCHNLYNVDLCGKKMIDWVLLAGIGCEERVIADPGENLIPVLQGLETDKRYIAVFYSDTPLLEKPLFHQIMNYFSKHTMNAMALPRGYVFETAYLRQIERFSAACPNDFDEMSFTVIDSAKVLSSVAKILYDKIRSFHLRNGVVMYGAGTIFIDADVEIERGVLIYPNNLLRGESYIGKNVILEANNIIQDSIIADGATVMASYIEKSKVGTGKSVGPFEKLVNTEI